MRHRKENYIVGFGGEGRCVYGRDNKDRTASLTDPMTLAQAKTSVQKLMKLQDDRTKRYIFKLVPVETID